MQCPRLEHFIRLQPNGTFGKCGHMINGKEFKNIESMQNSVWSKKLKKEMSEDRWPKECMRCEMTEKTSGTSIRLDTIERDRILRAIKKDYFIVGGVLDNICNSACQSCNETLSTKIGSLQSRDYVIINNYDNFFSIPQERIIEVDVNGGEPAASPNYKKLLNNLPKNIKIVRLNTNGSRMIPEILRLLKKGIRVIVTLSFDGTEKIHDYVRWPVQWSKYKLTVARYCKLRQRYKNLRINMWTTVSSLNICDLDNILNFADENNIKHSYGFCVSPGVLDIRYKNKLTSEAKRKFKNSKNTLIRQIAKQCATMKNNSQELIGFVSKQDRLRGISFEDYLNFKLNLL